MKSMKYHVSKDGIVRECKARNPEACPVKGIDGEQARHFDSVLEGKKYSENTMREHYGETTTLVKKTFRTPDSFDKISKTFSKFPVFSGSAFSENIIHYSNDVIKLSNIGDAVNSDWNKPNNALWCALEDENSFSWAEWNRREGFSDLSQKKKLSVKLDDNAVVLQLSEDNIYKLEEFELITYKEKVYSNDFRGSVETIDFEKLREMGVDALYVQGSVERGFFYGWDVDSLVVLKGNSVIGIEELENDFVFDEEDW